MNYANRTYPNINMEKTGILLRDKVSEQGYTVKDIQKYLGLSCPQPIYRWFKGKVLPSLDHLLMLSRILHVHMEELLVLEIDGPIQETEKNCEVFYDNIKAKYGKKQGQHGFLKEGLERLSAYWKRLDGGAVQAAP